MSGKAMVLLSGGLDSLWCLRWAMDRFESVDALHFWYFQRHWRESGAARAAATLAGVPFRTVTLAFMKHLCPSALTTPEAEVVDAQAAATVVPGRNAFFLTAAAVAANQAGADNLVFGGSAEDHRDYPDCRPPFVTHMERALRCGFDWPSLRIHAPLSETRKDEVVRMLKEWGGWIWEAASLSVTCYERNPPRGGCGRCPSCRVRSEAFAKAGLTDPARAG